MSKRARRLNYKPILDDTNNKNKGRRKESIKVETRRQNLISIMAENQTLFITQLMLH